MKDEKSGKVTMIPQPRRKGTGSRVWLVVSELGQSRVEEVGKHSIMRRTGLPARDLRVLDPLLSYPSTILGRERAIVINLEHIKAIVTAKEVLMVNSTNPLVVQFVQDLQHRVCCSSGVPPSEVMVNSGLVPNSCFPVDMSSKDMKSGNTRNNMDEPVPKGPMVLPFEFRALEVCLESACRCLDSETRTLEQEAYPALDELTSKISTLNLERVRQIKSRLVALSGRVQKMRDELEHLLDDDNDMAEMYLTEKLIGQTLDQEPPFREEVHNDDVEADDARSESASEVSHGFKPNIEELEMLLEAYFAQIDGILQKISDMSEYVDDTEDCINIMLDDKQNQLLQMGVMLSTANMILNAGIVVVGLFGMNINIGLFSGQPHQFWETALGTVGGCVALTLIAFGWGKKKRLLAS